MRRSTLYILILVAAGIIASALFPQIAVRVLAGAQTAEANDNSDRNTALLAPGQMPAAIVLPEGGCNVTIETDSAATQLAVNSSDSEGNPLNVAYNTAEALLKITDSANTDGFSNIIITLPAGCSPTSIACRGRGTILAVRNLATDALSITSCPFRLEIDRCNIGLLAIGGLDGIEDDERSDFVARESTIDTLAGAFDMRSIDMNISASEIGCTAFALK